MRPTLNVKSISERLEGTRAFVPLRTMYHNLFRPGFAKKRLARTTFYGQFVRPGDLVFDVGANYGEYSAFIDDEHTNSAVFRDFTSVRKFLASAAIVAFHDCFVTPSAFLAISRILSRERPPSPFFYFPSSNVLAVVFGSTRLEQGLLNFGWRKELPLSRWDNIKMPIKRRIRSIMPLLRRYKRRFV
jgi:hypothetical protein